MLRSIVVGLIVVVLVSRAVTGFRLNSSTVERNDTLNVGTASLQSIEIRTENGTIAFDGQDNAQKAAQVDIVTKATASTPERAQAALKAIEVTVTANDTIGRIGWHWKQPQESDWSAAVNFRIRAPRKVNILAETQNGSVNARDLTGDVRLTTSNGSIDARTSGGTLDARTKNGSIDARYSGPSLQLHTDNGSIEADVAGGKAVAGSIATRNGSIELTFGKESACLLRAMTKSGRIRGNGIASTRKGMRGRTETTIGAGGDTLDVQTTNGTITIRKPNAG